MVPRPQPFRYCSVVRDPTEILHTVLELLFGQVLHPLFSVAQLLVDKDAMDFTDDKYEG